MNIGVSALFQASGGSLSNLVRLLREWDAAGALERHRVVLFAGGQTERALREAVAPAVLAKLVTIVDGGADRGLVRRLVAEQFTLLRRLREHRIDVLFSPANIVPWLSRIPSVVVFQNAAPFCESVTFRSLRGSRWWFRFQLLRLFVRASARKATRVVFLSQWFRDLFVSRYRFPPDRGEVIPHAGVSAHEARRDEALERAHGILGPYLLYVSHLNPYKNVLEVIEGFAAIARDPRHEPVHLVVTGMTNFPWYRRAIEERIAALGLGGRVILTGLVSQAAVDSLLAGCTAFVFASTCENCPTALVEALSAGVPVAASSVGVMPEVAGDAAIYFDPSSPAEIGNAMRRLLGDEELRASLQAKAGVRAAEFPSEAEVARRILAAIESVAGEPRP